MPHDDSPDIWNNSVAVKFVIDKGLKTHNGLGLRFMEMGHFGEGSSTYGKIKYF